MRIFFKLKFRKSPRLELFENWKILGDGIVFLIVIQPGWGNNYTGNNYTGNNSNLGGVVLGVGRRARLVV